MIPRFRAWWVEREVMCDVDVIGFSEGAITVSNKNTTYEHLGLNEVELMQSTGLKDKNGVDVFEGDYLSWISFESQKEFKGEVVFSKGSFCMVVRLKGHDYKVPLHELSEFDNLIEVLGNIYEYPELLEVME